MRVIVAASAVLLALSALGCEPGSDIEFVNETAEPLCYYADEEYSYCYEISAHETRTHTKICENNSVRLVLITPQLKRDLIYEQRARCHDWDGVTVTISQQDGSIVVSDTLD